MALFLADSCRSVHVLLIEDDALVAHGLAAGLRLHGFTVDHAATAAAAEAAVATAQFDICILDLGLPDADGSELLARWRARGWQTPLLVLTARDAISHRVRGLQLGADDYVLKPFDLEELVARVHAILRRAAGRSSDRVSHGDLVYEPSTGRAWLRQQAVELSRRERALLAALLQHPARILSAEQLQDRLYGLDQEVGSNALNVHIHHLRRKLGPAIVETVRGEGYRLGPAG